MANYNWTGTDSKDWGDPNNWTVAGIPATAPPGINDNITIDAGSSTITVTTSSPVSVSCASLTLDSDAGGSIALAAGPAGTITTGALSVTGFLEVSGQGLLVDTGAATFASGATLDSGRTTVAGAATFGSSFTLDNAELDLSSTSTATLSTLTLVGGVALSGNLTTAVLADSQLTSLKLGTQGNTTFGVTNSSSIAPAVLPALTVENDVALTGIFTTTSLADIGPATLSLMAGDALTVTGDVLFAPNYPFCSVALDGGTMSVAGTFHAGLWVPFTSYAPNTIENGGTLTVGSLVDCESNFSIGAGGVLTVNGDVTDSTYNGAIRTPQSGFRVDGAGATFNVGGTFVSGNDTIVASGGAVVRLGALTQDTSGDGIAITVDASSHFAIGSGGGAAGGILGIAAGISVAESGSFSAPIIRENGSLSVVAHEKLTLNGAVEGTGTVTIGAGSTLTMTADKVNATAAPIMFSGQDGILALDTSDINASQQFASPIHGFGEATAIDFSGATITSAQYANGVLDLYDGTAVEAVLNIGQGYTNDFSVLPVSGGYQIDYLEAGSTASAGTPSAASYQWIAGFAGGWNDTADWANTTAGQSPAAVAPGTHDTVTIGGLNFGKAQVIVGNGAALGLTVAATASVGGETWLDGAFTIGAGGLSVGQYQSVLLTTGGKLAVAGDVTLGSNSVIALNGAKMSVTGDAVLGAASHIALDGSSLTVKGTFYGDVVGSNPISNTIEDGATLTVGTVVDSITHYAIGAGSTFAVNGDVSNTNTNLGPTEYSLNGARAAFTVAGTFAGNNDAIGAANGAHVRLAALNDSGFTQFAVDDGTSSIGIGTAGFAKGGTITIAAGTSATADGSLQAPSIVNDGTLIDSGSLLLEGAVTGSGTVSIAAGSTLQFNNDASGSAIQIGFAGPSGTLDINTGDFTASGHFAPVISGFDWTDKIFVDGISTITNAQYTDGVLGLYAGTTLAASLDIGTGYANAFAVLPLGAGREQINYLGTTNPAPAGTASADSYQWTGPAQGAWNSPANWTDTTAAQSPAALAPGANDSVLIQNYSNAGSFIYGDGNANALTFQSFSGTFGLDGNFHVGAGGLTVTHANVWLFAGSSLAVAGNATFAAYEYLALNGGTMLVTGTFYGKATNSTSNVIENGGSLTVGNLVDSGTAFSITAGSALTVHGNVSDAGAASSYLASGAGAEFDVMGKFISGNDIVSASDGAKVQIKALAEGSGAGVTLTVGDASSSIEIGKTGSAAAGTLVIDTGVTVTEAGVFSAPAIVDNGKLVVAANETLTLNGMLKGTGTVTLKAGSTLTLNTGVSATDTLAFSGSGATLDLIHPTASSAKISGFASGDAVNLTGAWSFVSFNESGNTGTLTLKSGTHTIAMKFAGALQADNFSITTGSTTTIAFVAAAGAASVDQMHGAATTDAFDFGHDRIAVPRIDALAMDMDEAGVVLGANPGHVSLTGIGASIYLVVDREGTAGFHSDNLIDHHFGAPIY
ncbi:MAG TPA: hypothetical protein VGG10_20680 [Rhizomicrobium sp.]